MISQFVAGANDDTLKQEFIFTLEDTNPILPTTECVTVRVTRIGISDGVPTSDMEDMSTTLINTKTEASLEIQLYALKLIADTINENLPKCRATAELVKNHIYFATYQWPEMYKWLLNRPVEGITSQLKVFADSVEEWSFRQFLAHAIATMKCWGEKSLTPAVVIKF